MRLRFIGDGPEGKEALAVRTRAPLLPEEDKAPRTRPPKAAISQRRRAAAGLF